MIDRITKKIEMLAEREYGGDTKKAAESHFRDHPEDWKDDYNDEVTVLNKRAGEDRKYINGEVEYRTQMIASRDNLNLDKPSDRLAAQEKVAIEYPDLYKRYSAANTIHVGKVSLTD